MKQNKDDYADVLKWCQEHKVRAVTDYIMMAKYNHDTTNLDNRLSLEEDADARVCGVGFSSCCMVANGNVYPCAGWQDYICGNLNESSLKDIWENSPKMQWLRKRRRGDFKECFNCKAMAN